MKLVIWIAVKSTYVATSNFNFTRKRMCMTTKSFWTFHTTSISVLIFSILYFFLLNLCFIRISILALRYHRNSSASPPVLGLWLPWPPLTVAIAAREIKDKQFVVYRHILTVCPIFIN